MKQHHQQIHRPARASRRAATCASKSMTRRKTRVAAAAVHRGDAGAAQPGVAIYTRMTAFHACRSVRERSVAGTSPATTLTANLIAPDTLGWRLVVQRHAFPLASRLIPGLPSTIERSRPAFACVLIGACGTSWPARRATEQPSVPAGCQTTRSGSSRHEQAAPRLRSRDAYTRLWECQAVDRCMSGASSFRTAASDRGQGRRSQSGGRQWRTSRARIRSIS